MVGDWTRALRGLGGRLITYTVRCIFFKGFIWCDRNAKRLNQGIRVGLSYHFDERHMGQRALTGGRETCWKKPVCGVLEDHGWLGNWKGHEALKNIGSRLSPFLSKDEHGGAAY